MSDLNVLEILLAALGGLLGWLGWSLKRLTSRVDELFEHRLECLRSFVVKEEVKTTHDRIQTRLEGLEARVGRIEGSCKAHTAGARRE